MPASERTDEIDLDHPDRVQIGVSRGETDAEIGRPRDYPDRADLSVSPTDEGRILVTLDAMAGDHGAGHADTELSVDDARRLRDVLDETVRWMIDGEEGDDSSATADHDADDAE